MALQTIAAAPLLALCIAVTPRFRRLGVFGFLILGLMLLASAFWQRRLHRISSGGWIDTTFSVTTSRGGPTLLKATDGTVIAVSDFAFRKRDWTGRLTDGLATGAYARQGPHFAVFLDDRADRVVTGRLPPPPSRG